MVGQHLKEYKKKFKQKIKQEKLCKSKDWKKRWLPYIKYDHDFDGGYFLELIVYKLHILLDYYEQKENCMQVDESRLQIVDNLKIACKLGDLILEDNFDKEVYAFSELHSKHYTKATDKKCWYELIIEWDSEENKEKYFKLIEDGEQERQKAIKEFFNYLAENYEKWWD